jgi:predicted DCC family thiol-disulfide oxidoreductase YuxK
MKQKERIVIFDGICGLCNASVNLLIKLDSKKMFRYTPLQGEFVKTLDIEPDIDSIIYYEDDILYYKSTAILKICQALGGVWRMTIIFYLIPKVIRDFIYDIIAKYRYTIFGKRESCRMPKEGDEELFID